MRSYLYVPADQPTKLLKALSSGADALICDLEDAVAVARKSQGRDILCEFLGGDHVGVGQSPMIWVRINDGNMGLDDISAVVSAAGRRLTGVYVPKVQTLERLLAVDRSLTAAEAPVGMAAEQIKICALLETAGSIFDARTLASGPRVTRLALGEADLRAEIGTELTPGDEREHLLVRQMVVLASAAAGLEAPVGPVSTDFRDLEAFRASTMALKRMGFRGRAAIHPAQVEIINDVFTPTAVEVERATHLIALFDASIAHGDGVCTDDSGAMVDEAVVRSARRTLLAVERRSLEE
jgi:citrate lyase subunit beta / citryl-CoA lyase